MKTLAILSVMSLGLGFGCQQAAQVTRPEAAATALASSATATTTAVEAPVLDVMLDTVEITVTAQAAMAAR